MTPIHISNVLLIFCNHLPPPEGYWLAFSGGKDSQCIFHLAELAGVKFDAHYNVTSVDPPELVRFIKEYYWHREPNGVQIDIPHDKEGKPITMWSLIRQHTIPPTRIARYCCSDLKESSGKRRVTVTGVRWAESARRKNLHGAVDIQTKSKKIINATLENVEGASLNSRGGLIMNDDNDDARRTVEQCYRTRKTIVNPIIDWTDEQVWEFLNDILQIPHCKLYDPPYNKKRLGCIGCPLAGGKQMRRDFEEYPKYRDNYIRAFERMIESHPGQIKILEVDDPVLEKMTEEYIESERERERESHGLVDYMGRECKEQYVNLSGGVNKLEADTHTHTPISDTMVHVVDEGHKINIAKSATEISKNMAYQESRYLTHGSNGVVEKRRKPRKRMTFADGLSEAVRNGTLDGKCVFELWTTNEG